MTAAMHVVVEGFSKLVASETTPFGPDDVPSTD